MASASASSSSVYNNPNPRKAGLLARAEIDMAVSRLEHAGGTAVGLDIRGAKDAAQGAAESDFLLALANDAGGAIVQEKQVGVSAREGLKKVSALLEEINRRTEAARAAAAARAPAPRAATYRATSIQDNDDDDAEAAAQMGEEEREVERGDPVEDDSELLLGNIFYDGREVDPFPFESVDRIPVIAEGNEEEGEEEEEEDVKEAAAEAAADVAVATAAAAAAPRVMRERRLSAKALENQATELAAAAAAAAEEEEARAAAMKRIETKAARARHERALAIENLEKKATQAAFQAEAAAAASKGPMAAAKLKRQQPDEVSSVGSRGTIAGKIIIASIRLEKATPDQQAIAIHGQVNFDARTTDGNACCALCGFEFSKRQGQHKKAKGLSISYDHFVPVNFAAIVFRVYYQKGMYSNAEFGILRSIGDMVCWHCNFEKSQRLFLTCPPGSFDGMKANPVTIGAFLDKMLESRHASGINEHERSTLLQCIADCYGPPEEEGQKKWKAARMAVIHDRAEGVARLIRNNVDYNNAKIRYLATRYLIAGEDTKLGADVAFQALPPAKQYIERRKRIASKFAEVEASPAWLPPWKKASVDVRDKVLRSNQPFNPAPCNICPAKPTRSKTAGTRTRRRRLPKLL